LNKRFCKPGIDDPPVVLKVEIPKRRYKLGEAVRITMILINTADKKVTLTFRSSQIFDILIESINGKVSYAWSSDKVFQQVITKKKLRPRESIRQDLEWIPDKPGAYRLRSFTANFEIDDKTLRLEAEPIMFEVSE
jgi:hypothetical protein